MLLCHFILKSVKFEKTFPKVLIVLNTTLLTGSMTDYLGVCSVPYVVCDVWISRMGRLKRKFICDVGRVEKKKKKDIATIE